MGASSVAMAAAGTAAAAAPLRRPFQMTHRPLVLVLFLCLAASTQLLLALYGLLSRYVQIKPSPPIPALRLVVICNLIGEAAMVAFHLLPVWGLRLWRRRKERQSMQLPNHSIRPRLAGGHGKGAAGSEGGSSQAGSGATTPPGAEQQDQQQPKAPTKPQLRAAASTVGPPAVLARGMTFRLERWQQRRPVLHRRLALAAIVVTFMGCCSLQILAPGFVDVSIVQLTTQWTTLGIALTQALLLRHRLPRVFWPCAAAMLGGACMVIVPSVGQSTSGSLNTLRGWMGFLMAVGALLSTVCYYILLQACRHLGFSPLTNQHLMNLASVLLFLCLSLPIDGASWAGQFGGWGAHDWLALVGLSTVAYLGSGMLMQVCVKKLGAPTAAMFFGLRLVFSVLLSDPMLGATVIQTGVQIAGVVITALAVTCYAGSQWWASRQAVAQQQQQGEQQREGEQQQKGEQQEEQGEEGSDPEQPRALEREVNGRANERSSS